MTRFYTDGQHLLEMVSERADQNFGRLGGVIRCTVLRDCADEDRVWTVDDLTLAALSEVTGWQEAA